MPFVKPISFQVLKTETHKELNLGSSQELEKKAEEHRLPRRQYQIYAPVIGLNWLTMGIPASRDVYVPILTDILRSIFSGQFDTQRMGIKDAIETTHEIAASVIHQVYFNLSKNHTPWEANKKEVLTQYKDVFCQLEAFGADWFSIRLKNKAIFDDLVRYVFNADSLTKALGDAEIGGAQGFDKFKELANAYLPLGANINAPMVCNPDFGTFLHYYLAFEMPYAVEFIQFIESKRTQQVHTQFHYEAKDGYGHTPLHIALMTRQEEAVLALLALNKKGIKTGINIASSNGSSPLLLAAALGMKKVVAELLKQGANPLVKDKNGLGLSDYVHFNIEKIAELVSPLLHTERSNEVNHSYLYYNDIWKTPLCFYEDDELEKEGDEQIPHLVVLSPSSPHKEKLERVVGYLKVEVKRGNKEAKTLLPFVMQQVDQVLGKKTFTQVCQKGQELVSVYLSSSEATANIRLYKEKQLRRACALGQLDVIKTLLEEGVDPNATDVLQRTALHYAVMRLELVQKEIVLEATDRGSKLPDDVLSQAELACQQHSLVIEYLQTYSKVPLNFTATNKTGNTAEAILLREAKSDNLVDAQNASECLEKINKISQVPSSGYEVEQESTFHL
ncbi:ankyrin repeat domain-containing protein [Legionella fallonii]|uniref:Ankyrin repeat protein n=1 Tax=Legionella fallonii LLAP-10 TaxID=1212491 RepID=A0A098G981_9GAMM|nr:ankyrin repeat domain-containing protein [Legionella fallonii]CEG58564.1 protein of unknown function [ankyrin repeat] [Legionella fallonii LLAP-10]